MCVASLEVVAYVTIVVVYVATRVLVIYVAARVVIYKATRLRVV